MLLCKMHFAMSLKHYRGWKKSKRKEVKAHSINGIEAEIEKWFLSMWHCELKRQISSDSIFPCFPLYPIVNCFSLVSDRMRLHESRQHIMFGVFSRCSDEELCIQTIDASFSTRE